MKKTVHLFLFAVQFLTMGFLLSPPDIYSVENSPENESQQQKTAQPKTIHQMLENKVSVAAGYTTSWFGGYGVDVTGRYQYYEYKRFSAAAGANLTFWRRTLPDSFKTPNQEITTNHSFFHSNLVADSDLRVIYRFGLINGIYGGYYNLNVAGTYKNKIYDINYSDSQNFGFWDYGIRTGFSFKITDKWAVELINLKSFRTVFEPLDFVLWAGGSEDAPTIFIFSVRYNLL